MKPLALVVVDLQERLLPVMHEKERLLSRCRLLLGGLTALEIPTLATQQYTKGLGPTVADLAQLLPHFDPIEKTAFSCFGAPGFPERLKATGCRRVALCGIEAHVCVRQTARDLLAAGYEVDLVVDAVSSRAPADLDAGIRRILAEGARPASVEMILFEILGDAKHPLFKDISRLVKEAG
ncbi:MAG: isochorismatase family protein [Spirochaetes bacterium]|nr:isochorismatase family protein [Spirochaetota bacterium]